MLNTKHLRCYDQDGSTLLIGAAAHSAVAGNTESRRPFSTGRGRHQSWAQIAESGRAQADLVGHIEQSYHVPALGGV
jgi:hypothetical protein